MKTLKIENNLAAISNAVMEVETQLKAYKIDSKDLASSLLTLEETLVKMGEAASETDKITLKIRKSIKNVKIRLSCRGNAMKMNDTLATGVLDDDFGPEAENMIRDMVLHANSERFRYHNAKGVNTVDIIVMKNKKAAMYETIGAMLLGFLVGLLVRVTLPVNMKDMISEEVFLLLYSIFLTLIKMIVTPLVFFSIAASISGFSDLSTLGRTGIKVFSLYMLTTIIAIAIALSLSFAFMPAPADLSAVMTHVSEPINAIKPSLIDTLLSMIPKNFLGAFVDSEMLQTIVLAVLVGTAVGKIGKHAQQVRNFIESMNDLFGNITANISKLLPLAVFGSTARMASTLDMTSAGLVFNWLLLTLLCTSCMIAVYFILLACLGRLNPITFIRKYIQTPITGMMTSSSNATMPTSLECCQRLGISPRIYSFSIPLGATVNMDGTSVMFVTISLFLAGLLGITIDGGTLLTFVFTVMLFSVATPGVPGAGTACILTLLTIVGVPTEAYGLLIGLSPIADMLVTTINVTSDGVVTTIVAKSEDALDMEKFNA